MKGYIIYFDFVHFEYFSPLTTFENNFFPSKHKFIEFIIQKDAFYWAFYPLYGAIFVPFTFDLLRFIPQHINFFCC